MNRISIVVPVYNVEKYLRRCIDSILQQTCPLYEVILVDDGSTDACPAICDEYAQLRPELIRVVHQNNQGLSAARNRGIDLAGGELIAFVDSDDYIEPDMYKRLLALLEKTNADIAYGGIWVEKENGERYRKVVKEIEAVWTREEALVEINSFTYIGISFWNELFKRELFRNLRFPLVLFEDNFMMYQVVANSERVVYTSYPVYHYIQRLGSISRNRSQVSLIPLDAMRNQLSFFLEKFPEIAYAAKTAYAIAHMDVYTQYIRRKMVCDSALLRKLRDECRRYLSCILRNMHLPVSKKLQAFAFCYVLPVYRMVVSRTEHR